MIDMTCGKPRYRSDDMAMIVPTKDRPEKVRNLLDSICSQTVMCGRVIVVDGGKPIRLVVSEYLEKLPVEYFECRPPSQIRQRNFGISKLDGSSPLVGFLDDDLVLEPKAFEEMINCWNRVVADVAGIGFNMVNIPPLPFTPLLGFALMSSSTPGKVLLSGFGSRIFDLKEDTRTQWLGGGYTVWKQEILKEFPQENVDSRWAIGEDLRFSYPIGKKYPLYVCARAKVRHEHVYDQAPQNEVFRYRGRKEALAILYFEESHAELSRMACLWMLIFTACMRVAYGCARYLPSKIQYAIGQADAILFFLRSNAKLAALSNELED